MSSQTTTKAMPYVRLGNSGLKVSRLILGMAGFGNSEWSKWALSEEEGISMVKEAYDVGIQTFDTSNFYSNGLSEVILGKAIKAHNLPREEIVVLTKVGFPVSRKYAENLFGKDVDSVGYVNQHGLSRKHIFDSIKASLERLQLDYVDVLQCHRFEDNTPIAETMQALHDVVKAGYVRYIGMSSCYAYQFQAMQNYAIANNLTPFISMQNHYSLLYREEEREMFPTLDMFGVGVMPWSPLARGLVSKPFNNAKTIRAATDPMQKHLLASPAAEVIISRVEEIAKKREFSMGQVGLAWVLSKPGVTAPVIGPTKLEYLHDLVASVNLQLTADEIAYLEEPYVPQGIIGH